MRNTIKKKKSNKPKRSITFRNKIFKLLQTRPQKSLSLDTIEAIDIITLDKAYPPNIVGSFKYIVHEYPADIDMFESYNGCCSLEKVAKDIADKFKEIAINNNFFTFFIISINHFYIWAILKPVLIIDIM